MPRRRLAPTRGAPNPAWPVSIRGQERLQISKHLGGLDRLFNISRDSLVDRRSGNLDQRLALNNSRIFLRAYDFHQPRHRRSQFQYFAHRPHSTWAAHCDVDLDQRQRDQRRQHHPQRRPVDHSATRPALRPQRLDGISRKLGGKENRGVRKGHVPTIHAPVAFRQVPPLPVLGVWLEARQKFPIRADPQPAAA